MTREYMLDMLGDIDDRFIAAASRIRPVRKWRGRKLVVLVAALIALLALGLISYAEGWFGLRSFLINNDSRDPEQTAEIGEIHNTTNSDVLSLQGYTDSPESMALGEWLLFLEHYDEDRAIVNAIGNQLTGFEKEYGCYSVYTQEMADKLEEILAKYGLKKHTRVVDLSYEQMTEAVGGIFFDEARHAHCYGYIYENGAFHMDGNWMSPEGNVEYQLEREVKGTLTDVALYLVNADDYEQWPYRSGQYELLLALSENHALLIADLGDAFVTLNILDGTKGRWMPEDAVLTKELMEQLADSFYWDVLATVRVSDLDRIIASAPVETTIWDQEDILDEYKGYGGVLRQIYMEYQDPNMIYALWDIDGDGECELLVQEGYGSANYLWCVYAHGQSLETICFLGEFPGSHVTLYAAEGGGIWSMQVQMGMEWLDKVTLEGEQLSTENVMDGLEITECFIPSDLELPCADITDIRPLLIRYSGTVQAHDNVLNN